MKLTDTKPYVPATSPETKCQILQRSFWLYKKVLPYVFFLSLAMAFVIFIPRLATVVFGRPLYLGLSILSPERLVLVVFDICSFTLFTAILWRIRCVMYNIHESIKEDFRVAIKKIPLVFAAAILLSLILLGMILAIFVFYHYVYQGHVFAQINRGALFVAAMPLIIGVMFYVYVFYSLIFYLALILTENDGIIESFKQSAALVWGNWWKTFFVQSTPWVSYLLTLIAIHWTTGIDVHVYFFHQGPPSYIATLIELFIFTLYIPWSGSVLLVQLQDLELRKKLSKS